MAPPSSHSAILLAHMIPTLTIVMHISMAISMISTALPSAIHAAKLPAGVNLSFSNFTDWPNSPLNCSIDGASAAATPTDICKAFVTGASVIFSAANSPTSARYQYLTKVQLWSSKHITSRAVSFSTSYVIEFLRSSDRRESGNFFSFGGGWAFAITPDQRVGNAGPESLGLFEIDPRTGRSLRGKRTKTVAVELDISRNSADVTFPDPAIPHVGLDIDSVRSVVTSPIGSFPKLVDRPIAVFIDYDAAATRLEVRVQKLSGSETSRSVPDKRKAKLYLSYAPLRLSDLVNEYSYVGFSTRVPVEDNGDYYLTSWKFSTKWVKIKQA